MTFCNSEHGDLSSVDQLPARFLLFIWFFRRRTIWIWRHWRHLWKWRSVKRQKWTGWQRQDKWVGGLWEAKGEQLELQNYSQWTVSGSDPWFLLNHLSSQGDTIKEKKVRNLTNKLERLKPKFIKTNKQRRQSQPQELFISEYQESFCEYLSTEKIKYDEENESDCFHTELKKTGNKVFKKTLNMLGH